MCPHMDRVTTYPAIIVVVLIAAADVQTDVLMMPTMWAIDHLLNDFHLDAPLPIANHIFLITVLSSFERGS